jgi:hypothetical protein
MKWIVIIAVIFKTTFVSANRDERLLLKCLGSEEKQFHLKKITGPLYDLNQRIISEMIQIPKAELSSENFKEICENKNVSPSWKLLELSISKGSRVFSVPGSDIGKQDQIAQGMIDDYIEITNEVFLNFMSQIQAMAPSPDCLEKEIPQLKDFLSDIKYLQEDVDMKKIKDGDEVIIEKDIFKFKKYPWEWHTKSSKPYLTSSYNYGDRDDGREKRRCRESRIQAESGN